MEPAYRWHKRPDHTGLDPAAKRQVMRAPAGDKTATGVFVRPRMNEVMAVAPLSSSSDEFLPADARLVVSPTSLLSAGAERGAVVVEVDWLEGLAATIVAGGPLPAKRRSFYALFDGHGGHRCAEWASRRLPTMLAQRLEGVHESAAIKAGVRCAFEEVDQLLLLECEAHGWADGCCVSGLLLDMHCDPPRAYVASLGSAQAYACSKEGVYGATRSVPVGKPHVASDAKEKARVEKAGGSVAQGLVGGALRATRSLGDAAIKRTGAFLSATPDVSSFEVQLLVCVCVYIYIRI